MTKISVLDLPSMQLDFDVPFGASCGLKNAEELLNYAIPYFQTWHEFRYNTHEFAQKFSNDGLTLWKQMEGPVTEDARNEGVITLQLDINNGDINGYILIHCRLSHAGLLH